MRTVWRIGALHSHGQRESFREPTRNSDGVKLHEAGVTVPAGAEQDGFPVARPADHLVNVWVRRQPLWNTACRGDNVDILIPVVLAGEGDHCSIRRENRID